MLSPTKASLFYLMAAVVMTGLVVQMSSLIISHLTEDVSSEITTELMPSPTPTVAVGMIIVEDIAATPTGGNRSDTVTLTTTHSPHTVHREPTPRVFDIVHDTIIDRTEALPSAPKVINIYHVIRNIYNINYVIEAIKTILQADNAESLQASNHNSINRYWVLYHITSAPYYHELKQFLDDKGELVIVFDIDLSTYDAIPLQLDGLSSKDPLHFYFRSPTTEHIQDHYGRTALTSDVYANRIQFLKLHLDETEKQKKIRVDRILQHTCSTYAQWALIIDMPYRISSYQLQGALQVIWQSDAPQVSYGFFTLQAQDGYTGFMVRSDVIRYGIPSARYLAMHRGVGITTLETAQEDSGVQLFIEPAEGYGLHSAAQLLDFALLLDGRVMADLHHYSRDDLFNYDEIVLASEKHMFAESDWRNPNPAKPIEKVFNELMTCANASVVHGPFSVVDKTKDPPSGDRHDYITVGPYWWPNPETPDGLPYVWRDGIRVPASVLYGEGSEETDSSRLWSFFGNTTCLTLASYFTDSASYGEKAAVNIRTWFLNPETRMNPNLKYAQLKWGYHDNEGDGRGIIEARYFFQLLDMIRLLHRGGHLSDEELGGLRAWFSEYLDFLENSEAGMFEWSSRNNHGTYFDVQASAIAAFIGDLGALKRYTMWSQGRLLEQIEIDGSMPHELGRFTQLHYIMFGFQALLDLARMASKVGVDLFSVTRPNEHKPLLQQVALWMLPHFNAAWEHPEQNTEDMERMTILFYNCLAHYPELASRVVNEKWRNDAQESHYASKSVFDQYSGIHSFWNLGFRISA